MSQDKITIRSIKFYPESDKKAVVLLSNGNELHGLVDVSTSATINGKSHYEIKGILL